MGGDVLIADGTVNTPLLYIDCHPPYTTVYHWREHAWFTIGMVVSIQNCIVNIVQ